MAWTAERIRSLLEEDEEMEDALRTIKAVADDNDGIVEWSDVEDDVTSGQWGRIIEEGILESVDEGFRFSDPEGVEELLDADHVASDVDLDIPEVGIDVEVNWTTWDKAAAAGAALLVLGYWFDPIQNLIGGAVNVVFGPLTNVLPFFVVIFAASLVTGTYSTLLQAHLMDTELMAAFQRQMNEIQEKQDLAEERGDDAAAEQLKQKQMELVTEQLSMFKEQLRPMVWIMLLTIPIFLWIWWMVGNGAIGHPESADMIMPIFGELQHWNDGIIGPLRGWIFWYILCSISFTQIMRKSLNVMTMPN